MAYVAIPAASGGGGGGVTSAVAGTGISVSGATGAVTFTNTAPFGADTIVQVNNASSTPVSSLEVITSLTTSTAGSEASKWVIKLLSAGAQVTALDLRPTQLLAPSGVAGAPGLSFQANTASGLFWDNSNTRTLMAINGTAVTYTDSTGLILAPGNSRIAFSNALDCTMTRDGSGRLVLDSSNGIILGNHNTAFFGATPVAKQTVGANVNNVAASGTSGQFDDFTNGTVYATDYAALHATVYQLTRSVAQLTVAVRAYALGG